ncbi:MAG: 50S ribosomal protein L4 [Candidatus Aminicenantales bacterium]|jgi:large subunit ribosomal protein L4
MAKAQVLDQNGNSTAEVDLPAAVFGGPVNAHLLYEAALNYQANQRRGTATTKTRAEVSGSNRKPWRQKGTGRARAGATRNPLWRKGGTTFGPRPKDYGYDMPKGAKTGALRSALAAKQADQALLIVGDLTLAAAKTKNAARLLKGLKIDSALVVDIRENVGLFTAMRNIPKVKAVDWRSVNTHDVLSYKWLVLSRQAFESLVEKLK